jgi:hypothetical protein
MASSVTANDPASDMVMGVTINSHGDHRLLNKQKFVETEIPKDHPIFASRPTHVGEDIGIPVLVQKLVLFYNLPKGAPDRNMNRTAVYLKLLVNVQERGWGFTNLFNAEDEQAGPIIVVCKDGKPITPRQVEALAAFCRFQVAPEHRQLQDDCLPELESDESFEARKEFVRTRVTRPVFEKYFEDFKEERATRDPSWADVASLYDV